MIKHYLTVALRNLAKYKTQTIISIIGLAVGITSFALSGMWLNYELTYDTFHEGVERAYIAGTISDWKENSYTGSTSPMLAQHLVNTFPEIEKATCSHVTLCIEDEKNDSQSYLEVKMADSILVSILPIVLLEGSSQYLYNPNEIAITRQAARRIFGNESPIGKPGPLKSTTITAIVEGWEHTNYSFDYVTKYTLHNELSWDNPIGRTTLLRVAPGTDIKALKKKLEKMEIVNDKGEKVKYPVIITPLTEEHYTHPNGEDFIRIEHVRLFCIISLLIVLSALANYLIMYLIRIRMRQREWALRKVNGASDASLMSLLVSELMILLCAAFLVGLFLMEISLSTFKSLSGIDENSLFFYKETAIYMSVVLCLALFFAWVTLFFQRYFTLQSAISSSSAKHFASFFRRTGLWLQLTISIGFIFCTVVMMQQLHHLCTSPDMGFTHPDVVILQSHSGISQNDYGDWLRKMHEIPGIEFREIADAPLYRGSETFHMDDWEGKQEGDKEVLVKKMRVSQEAFDLWGLQLVQGIFPKDSRNGANLSVLVNEAFVKKVGWKEAVGKKFAPNYIVCGVLKDIRLSPTVPTLPTIFTVNHDLQSYTQALIFDGSYKDAKRTIETYIRKSYPDFEFSAGSLRQMMEDALVSERALMKLLSVASIVCIIIAIFGIFSLVSLSCEQRRKEIAIRKVNGATIRDIIGIFIKEYMMLLVLAAIVAFPVGYVIMKRWLETYVIQTPVYWWIYAAILLAIIIIILTCIGWRIWQAARRNPAEEIKTE